jgi:hypothetical protein
MAGALFCQSRTLQGEKMFKMHDSTVRRSIRKFKISAASKTTKMGFAVLLAIIICSVLAFGQQSQREQIYMGGKAIATESSAFTAPTITITSPTTSSSYNTSGNSITIAGAASDASGISAVTWMNNRGGAGSCTGGTSWNCSGIGLLLGQNALVISARDNQNSFSTATLVVNYCTYSISPASASIAAAGGTGSVSVSCGGGCSWSASSNAGWITITAGGSGSGNGTMSYSVAANSGTARSGSITIAGQTYTINQDQSSCTFTISPSDAVIFFMGGGGYVSVSSNPPGCSWTASSNDEWISISGVNYSSGIVYYSVSPNTTPVQSRVGSINIAGQSFSVDQQVPSQCSSCYLECMAMGYPYAYCGGQCGCF